MNVKKLFEIMSKASSITFTNYGIAADDKTYAVTIEEFSGLPKTAEKVAEKVVEKVSEPKVTEKVSDVIKTVAKTISKEIEETSKTVQNEPKSQNEPKKVAAFMVKSDEWSEKLLLERIADFKTKFKKRAKDARVKIAYIMDKVSVLEENQKYIKDIGYKIKALKNVNLPEALDIVNDSIKSLKGEKTVQKNEDTSIVPYEAEARYYVRYYWLKLEDEVKSHALCAEFVNSMGLKITAKTASFYCPVIHDEDDANVVTSRLSVISWQTEHPNENVTKCSEELGLSMSLCRRWWNFNDDVIRINTTDLAGNPV